MIVQVTRDGATFTGDIVEREMIREGNGTRERLTVRRHDNATLIYVHPHRDQITEVADQPSSTPGLEHLAPPPGIAPEAPSDPNFHVVGSVPHPSIETASPGHQAPPVGVSVGGTPIVTAPPVRPEVAPVPLKEEPEQFMVQPKAGKTSVYHTRTDCPRVTDAPRKAVNDDDITFFDLTPCASCRKRDGQISATEAMAEVLDGLRVPNSAQAAEAVADALRDRGFRITPQVIER